MGYVHRVLVVVAILTLLAALLAGCRGGRGEATDVAPVEEPPPGPRTERTVLVLCYHAMSPGAESTYDVPTEDFAEQLALISDEGFESVTVSQIADYLDGRGDLPDRAVSFTFDDGPESVLTESKPMMAEHGYVGTAFLISDAVGGEGKLDWDQVRELQAAGWEIGSHTSSHIHPTRVGEGKCREEFERSKAVIDREIEGECISLAYPYGLYDETVTELAREAGYRIAFTIDRGPADWTDHAMRVPRQMLVNGNSLTTFSRWLSQRKIHLEDMEPPIGERLSTTTPTITAVLADEDVPVGELEISRDGNPVSYDADADTRTITFTPELSEGANNLRINYYGSPRREVSWVIVCGPS